MSNITVQLATGFDTDSGTEQYSKVKLTTKEAREVIESLLRKLDYKQAKAWIDSQKGK